MSNTLAIQPYLYFGGRCEEALTFYSEKIGAKIEMLMRFKDSPDPLPPDMLEPGFEDKVMHATFHIGESTLMASDGCGGGGNFDGFSLSLAVKTESEANQLFAALAEGGEIKMPLGKTFWSPGFGMLTDKFGMGWMINLVP
jgi:PhnB protein